MNIWQVELFMNRENYMNNDNLSKVPPQSIEAEEAVLGAMMLERDAVDTALIILPRESNVFYKDANAVVYKAILSLYGQSQPVDILTVTAELRSNGDFEVAGGAYVITSLTTNVNSSANIEKHCRIMMQSYFARLMIQSNMESVENLYKGGDVFDIIEREYTKLLYIQGFTEKRASKTLTQIVDENIETNEIKYEAPLRELEDKFGVKIFG